jgi:hypothetical protein
MSRATIFCPYCCEGRVEGIIIIHLDIFSFYSTPSFFGDAVLKFSGSVGGVGFFRLWDSELAGLDSKDHVP